MNETLLAIDPGNEQSAYVLFDGEKVIAHDIVENRTLLSRLGSSGKEVGHVAIEGIACYGMPVGKETFDTCIWIGRFIERWESLGVGADHTLVYRQQVKLHLCGQTRAKDANVRQALIDRFGPGKEKAIGKKKTPGPLHGISSHCWSALAVAVTWWDANT